MRKTRVMAFVREIEHRPERTVRWTTETSLSWTSADVAGHRILHLETFGSDDRKSHKKGSQYLHFDREGARALLDAIRATFPELD
jgi:hypothetical protein